MDIHEFLENHLSSLKEGKATPEQVRFMLDELLEMAVNDERAFKSQLERLMAHLLKYQFQQDHQTRSWFLTIQDAFNACEDYSDNKVLKRKIEGQILSSFRRAVKLAMAETGLPRSKFPTECPESWTIQNLINEKFIEEFLYNFVKTREMQEVLKNYFGKEPTVHN